MQLLVQVKDPNALQSGVIAGTPESQDAVWRVTKNVWFGEHGVEVAGGMNPTDTVPASVFSIAGAEVFEEQVLYLGGSDGIYYWSESRNDFPSLLNEPGTGWHIGIGVGGEPISRRWDLLPWGAHLITTDNNEPPQYWAGDPDVTADIIEEALTKFGYTKILKKLANHVLAYNNETGENRVDWSDVSDPLTWAVDDTNSAGGITIRDLNGPIQAVVEIGDALMFVGHSQAGLTRWIGGNDVFSNTVTIHNKIGALGKDCVVSDGRIAYGIGRHGVWRSDGFEVQDIGDPSINRWLRSNMNALNLGRGYLFGFYDGRRKTVWWYFLDQDNEDLVRGIGFHTTSNAWMQSELPLTAGMGSGVFNWPIVAKSAEFGDFGRGLNVGTGEQLTSTLRSGFFACGTADRYKQWDKVSFELEMSGEPTIRVGYSEFPEEDEIEWSDEQPLSREVWLGDRESLFMCFEISTSTNDDYYRIGSFGLWGEKTGARS